MTKKKAKMNRANLRSLRTDPTRTRTIVRAFSADINRRYREVAKAVKEAVVKQDVFGLKTDTLFPTNVAYEKIEYKFSINVGWQEFRFSTDAQKIGKFREWFQDQVDAKILSTTANGEPWSATYVESAYKKGVVRAYTDTRPNLDADQLGFYNGQKSEFLKSAFAAPEATSKIQLVATRSFETLRGINSTMSSRLNMILADSLANGYGADKIARMMTKQITSMSKVRAKRLARTELAYAHAEGQLDSFERLGIEELGVMAEWHTAGDNRVCPLCAPLESVTIPVKKARGMLPRHPNCRCAWIPAFSDMKEEGQKRGKRATKAIKKSRKAQEPKA